MEPYYCVIDILVVPIVTGQHTVRVVCHECSWQSAGPHTFQIRKLPLRVTQTELQAQNTYSVHKVIRHLIAQFGTFRPENVYPLLTLD